MSDVTRILSAIEQGDGQAAEELLRLVYGTKGQDLILCQLLREDMS